MDDYMRHLIFDCLAVTLSMLAGWLCYVWRFKAMAAPGRSYDLYYFTALIAGSVLGGFLFGSLNLALSGVPMAGKSIAGSLAGAIVTTELYKKRAGVRPSTGFLFAAPFCVTVAVGRIGCQLSGLADHTYGTPTSLPWGWDFGDHVARHPVALYESLSMAACLLFLLWLMAKNRRLYMACGFYFMVLWYAVQRFIWEFLKPYGTVFGPFNMFHILCAALVFYALAQISRVYHERKKTGALPVLWADDVGL